METQDRRTFLRAASAAAVGAGFVALPGPTAGTVLGPGLVDWVNLRRSLEGQREKIQSLKFVLESDFVPLQASELEEGAGWTREGRSEFYYDNARYRLDHYRDNFHFVEISVGESYYKRAEWLTGERQPEVMYDGPVTHEHRLHNRISSFMPAPQDRPAYDQGMSSISGEPCQVIGQDRYVYFISLDKPRVLRRDVFADSDSIAWTHLYARHREILAGVYFPTSITQMRHSAQGQVQFRVEITIRSIVVNETVPDHLFVS